MAERRAETFLWPPMEPYRSWNVTRLGAEGGIMLAGALVIILVATLVVFEIVDARSTPAHEHTRAALGS